MSRCERTWEGGKALSGEIVGRLATDRSNNGFRAIASVVSEWSRRETDDDTYLVEGGRVCSLSSMARAIGGVE